MSCSTSRRLLLSTMVILVATGCSAKLESDAMGGQTEDYRHDESLQRSVSLSWRCRTTSLVSSLFSPSGDSPCGDDRGYGEASAPINPDGTFEMPAVDSRVTKFLSVPSFYFRLELVTIDENGEEDRDLLTGGKIINRSSLRWALEPYRSLRHIVIEDVCVDASIVVTDGQKQLSFDDILREYPDSHNMTREYVLQGSYRKDGVNVLQPNFRLHYNDGKFCGSNLGLFVPAVDEGVKETLYFFGRVEASAGVVYSISAPNPVSGQRKRDYRWVRDVTTRKGESPVSPVGEETRLADELLVPIELELDITHKSETQ